MRGKGVSSSHYHPGTCSGKKTCERCKVKGNFENAVVIDVESNKWHNVIIIDELESPRKKFQHSSVSRKDEQFPSEGVISIDDDEANDVDDPGIGVSGCGDMDSDATSSKRSYPTSFWSKNSLHSVGNECQFIREKKSAFKFSKCKQTYSGKTPDRNHYGLFSSSDNGSSDSDCSDCELMEGPFDKVREQWEKASLKRKYGVCNSQSGLEDQGSASGSHSDLPPNIEVENRSKQHTETPMCSNSNNRNFETVNFCGFTATDGYLGGISLKSRTESPFVETNRKVDRDGFSALKSGPTENIPHFQRKADTGQSSSQYQGNKQDSHVRTWFQGKVQNVVGEHLFPNAKSTPNVYFNSSRTDVEDKEAPSRKNQHSTQAQANVDGVVSSDEDEDFLHAPSSCNVSPNTKQYETTSFKEEEKLVSRKPLALNPLQSDDSPVDYATLSHCAADSADKGGTVYAESILCNTSSLGRSEASDEKTGSEQKEKPSSGECSDRCNETQINHGKSCLDEAEKPHDNSPSTRESNDQRHLSHAQEGDVTGPIYRDIINGRERVKETDEYKRAAEEEWAARQRELQIQAEEAQRLRKKRRAETMRLLDMERRQKQRVEEMRETQKKDEENMNLKEQFRVEIRKELSKLEMACPNMASLLRGLGIHMEGGFCPMSDEVRAAYKRALLRFHPDRASRLDIRQQVESEEKFKLISRMKEKFLSTSCY